MILIEEETIETLEIVVHDGTKKHSGRYPWGSGKQPYQHSGDFMSRVEELSKDGISQTELAKKMDMTTTDLRMQLRVANHERRQLKVDQAKSLRSDGRSLVEIAKIMGYPNDSSVRSLLNENTAANKNKAKQTSERLKQELEKKGDMLDVGVGAERVLGVSPNTLKEAMFILETEGYHNYKMGIPSINNPGKQLNRSVLAKPEVPYADVYKRIEDAKPVGDYHSDDGGDTFTKKEYPASLDSKRIKVLYGDEGGSNKDGVIELRRGVDDLSLGKSHYAQVRILVDGTHYLKGMAMYSNDMPPGVDVIFNTNKKSGTPKLEVFKPIKKDQEDPFGAYYTADGQSYYPDPKGKFTDPVTGKKQSLSPINKLKEEGDWDNMSKNLSSQFLSKQPMDLINKQLNLTYADKQASFDEINSLTNPTVKKKMLMDFANECDGAAVHLKSAALPRQKTQVLLPLNGIKENEIYAPNFSNGEKVALVRYPHGGTFEIPVLTVNNKNKAGIAIFGKNVKDTVGIHPSVAEILSGADFDGDQVVVIPTNSKVRIQAKPPLDGLKNFNPKDDYPMRVADTLYIPKGPNDKTPLHEGKEIISTLMTKKLVGKQMGMISNLITDMTLKGAPEEEMTRAIKHSMVVIDAEKHKLDYVKSEKDNRIKSLKQSYQGYTDSTGKEVGGATTVLSRRKQSIAVNERKGSGVINPDTGQVTYRESGRVYVKPTHDKATGISTFVKVTTDKETGVNTYITTEANKKEGTSRIVKTEVGTTTHPLIRATSQAKLLLETPDINTLSSGTLQEKAYANYANKMKALGNEARKTLKATGNLEYSKEARDKYATEVDTLNARLGIALDNAPKERAAHALANSVIKAKIQSNPDMDTKEIKKAGQLAIYNARDSFGASGKKTNIIFTDKEWEAIQAGAITDTKLSQILKYADPDSIKERAMPKTTTALSTAAVNRIQAMQSSGYTNDEIAKALGKSTSTVTKYLNQ